MDAKISMFATRNDTSRYAVAVDGYYGLCASETEARRIYDLIGGQDGDDGLAGTWFGSAEIIPPGYIPRDHTQPGLPEMTRTRLSDARAIDIEEYISKTIIRGNRRAEGRYDPLSRPFPERHAMRHALCWLNGACQQPACPEAHHG